MPTSTTLYPILTTPLYRYAIWGGQRLAQLKGCPPSDAPIGESYELSALDGFSSIINNGPLQGITLRQLMQREPQALCGEGYTPNDEFPLLIKLIDAAQDLSIQVHPDDHLAQQMHLNCGKNEMWYIVDATPEARIGAGLRAPLDEQTIIDHATQGTLEHHINYLPVQKGDLIDIPAGTIHTICRGCLIFEVQQPIDVTYRLYDYKRLDRDGQERELHLSQAQRAIKGKNQQINKINYHTTSNVPTTLINSQHFTVQRLLTDQPLTLTGTTMHYIQVLSGVLNVSHPIGGNLTVHPYQSVLLPYEALSTTTLQPDNTTEILIITPPIKQPTL